MKIIHKEKERNTLGLIRNQEERQSKEVVESNSARQEDCVAVLN